MNGLEPTGNLDREVKAAGCDNVCEYLEKFEGAGKHVFKSKTETVCAIYSLREIFVVCIVLHLSALRLVLVIYIVSSGYSFTTTP